MSMTPGDIEPTGVAPYGGTGTWASPSSVTAGVLAGQGSADPYASYASEPQVYRRGTYLRSTGEYDVERSAPKPPVRTRNTAGLTDFSNEFYDRWDDGNFRAWFISRAVAAGMVNDPTKATVGDYWDAWSAIGKMAASARWSGTPEQYLEFRASGQRLSEKEVDQQVDAGTVLIDPNTGQPIGVIEAGEEIPEQPITTATQTTYASLNQLTARAAIDRMSQALLGRRASKAEIKRYRAAMEDLLKRNPQVSTRTTDATDPNNVKSTVTEDSAGMTQDDAVQNTQYEMQDSSEGRAYTVGSMFEDALAMMAQREN